jgi:hypothetical protein
MEIQQQIHHLVHGTELALGDTLLLSFPGARAFFSLLTIRRPSCQCRTRRNVLVRRRDHASHAAAQY